MSLFFIFSFIGEANWREYNRDVAGWWDVIGITVITLVVAVLLFSWITASVILVVAIIVVYYFHIKQ